MAVDAGAAVSGILGVVGELFKTIAGLIGVDVSELRAALIANPGLTSTRADEVLKIIQANLPKEKLELAIAKTEELLVLLKAAQE